MSLYILLVKKKEKIYEIKRASNFFLFVGGKLPNSQLNTTLVYNQGIRNVLTIMKEHNDKFLKLVSK